jgi:hypothetical protein
MAILSNPEKTMVLSDIYQWILDNYLYFRNRGPGWRNSIRHNLSLNDCFMKAGRSANGKGHYWAIHPANLEDFQKGDFRRRRAQRRVRKSLGLIVPEEEEDEDEDDDEITSPSTLSPLDTSLISQKRGFDESENENLAKKLKKNNNVKSTLDLNGSADDNISISEQSTSENSSLFVTQDLIVEENDSSIKLNQINNLVSPSSSTKNMKRRGFDVDDILAPDRKPKTIKLTESKSDNSCEHFKNHNSYSNVQNNYQLGLNQALFYRNYYLMQQKDPMFFHNFQSALNNQTKNLHSLEVQKQNQVKQARQSISNNIDAENWKRTFEKIMARSYKNQNNQSTNQVDDQKHGPKRKHDND